jgi:hypothetical protein
VNGSSGAHRAVAPSRRKVRVRTGLAALLAAGVSAGLLITAGSAAAATNTRVSDADITHACTAPGPNGFCEEETGAGKATVVDDARANAGTGYLRLSTPGGSDKAAVTTGALNGVLLSTISDLAFQTYIEQVATSTNQAAPALNIPIKPNKADATFSTLVWEPIYTNTPVVPGQWQSWTPSTSAGGWWATGALSDTGTPNKFGFNTYTATFAQVKAALPNATIYGVGVNQGSGAPGLVAGVDQLKVNDTTYDFDNAVPPPAGPPRADVSVKVDVPASVRAGSTVNISVTVTNAGPFAADRVATAVTLPASFKVTNAPGGIAGPHNVAYVTPTIAAGHSVTFPITAVVDGKASGTPALNVAALSSVKDPNLLNNIARPTVRITH